MNSVENPTVLILDDEPMTRKVLQLALNKDFNTVIKDDGMAGMSWIETGAPVDLIVADLNMPHLNGKEFLKVLRSSNMYGHIPVIILSGSEESNDRIQCLELGADDFMTKPFNPMEITAKVKAVLRRVYR
ncbi:MULTISPECIES: response regulator transcription factor [unclassified Siphonobacter]|uniref:response regulator transcription factor n=1 Tax=unclassified Siphonobacter TaxID=2635712 RepID=UPI000CB2392C|nr:MULTISPECIES: response regulator transcription factor [unclassified Siphonobacter]MDQ1086918.1 DNA-binding response OmpR family regulator [Siphonobacter sp. SORGH_AS_1065]MDR6193028.1 DNA-binding response OmpR family regulator [Siphonobacter sp. SORGH_AS_0500]PKK35692.1 two-component system response regulator [Siphonobacter sp. SORGH_AS_0500]